MKKKLVSILTVFLLLTILVGCGEEISYTENETALDTPIASEDTNKVNPEAEYENQEEYLSCIIVDDTNDFAYFDMTVDEFVANYNKSVNNSDNYEEVKTLMRLKQSVFLGSDDEFEFYDVTNPVVATNRSAVNITITTRKDSKNVYSVNFTIPNSAGPNTNISDDFMRAVFTLTTPTNSLSADEAEVMYDKFIANSSTYYKGMFWLARKQGSADVYRIGAITEEEYNWILSND